MEARFKRPGIESSWRYGLLMTTRAPHDSAIEVVVVKDTKTGGLYAVRREVVQVVKKGPRGGRSWRPL